jgi:galactonate dehydratase
VPQSPRGNSSAKKIAALAEARNAGVVPHNPLGPISTAACLQIAACIPNFALQEYPIGEDVPPKCDFVKKPLERDGGFLIIPTAPGIGIDLDFEGLKKHPYRPRDMVTRLHVDGSVVDQ